MGNYTQLYIGRLYLSWKNQIPSILTFLFSGDDFYSVWNDEDECFEQMGYRTTCGRSIDVLNRFGYTVEFFAEVYDFFYKELYSYYVDASRERVIDPDHGLSDDETWNNLQGYLDSFPKLTRVAELYDFISFLKAFLDSDLKTSPFDEPRIIKLTDGKEYSIELEQYLRPRMHNDLTFVDFEAMQMYLLEKQFKFPPWIPTICYLFGDGFVSEYPEIISLMYVRLALETVGSDEEIRLELSDIVENEQDVRNLHVELVTSLVDKVNLYNRVFKVLFRNEEEIRTRYIKTQVMEILAICDSTENKYEKGRLLEDLIELLFTSNNSLDLVDKRVSTGDEEIDLVVKNNISRPFWIAFGSPLFFIECKNWSSPVGSKHVRDFELKLQNHAKLAKVGFFVSINGFSSEVYGELKRLGRDQYHIVLLDRDDIREYVSSEMEFFYWLEKKASKFH